MMIKRPLVSVVDDDESVRESLPDLLRGLGYSVRVPVNRYSENHDRTYSRLLRRAGGSPSPRVRNGKPERGSRTLIQYGPELATVTFDNGTTDQQSNAHTAALGGVERLE